MSMFGSVGDSKQKKRSPRDQALRNMGAAAVNYFGRKPDQGPTGSAGKSQSSTPNVTSQASPTASETRPDKHEAVESKESVPKKSSWLPSLRNPLMPKATSVLDNVYDASHADDLKHFTADFSEGERTAEEREAAGAPTWDNIAPKFREKAKAMPGGDSRAVRRGDWQKTRLGGFVHKDDGVDTAAQPYSRGQATPGGTAPLKEPTRRQDMIADLGHSMQQGRQKVGSVGGTAVKTVTETTEKAHKALDRGRKKFDTKMDSAQEAMDDVEEKAGTADDHLGHASDEIHGKTEVVNRTGADTSEIDSTVDSAHSTGSGVLSAISGAASQVGEHLDDIHGAFDDALDFIPGFSEANSVYRIGKSAAIGMDLDSRITAHNLEKSKAATTAREGGQSARKLASGRGLAGLMKQKSAVTN